MYVVTQCFKWCLFSTNNCKITFFLYLYPCDTLVLIFFPSLASSCFKGKVTLSCKTDKGNWSQTAFDWSQSITIMITAAAGQRVALLFLMELTGLRMAVNGS